VVVIQKKILVTKKLLQIQKRWIVAKMIIIQKIKKAKAAMENVTTSTQFSVVFFEIQFNNSNFAFSEKKSNYFNSEDNLSSGFSSLWLIPKIS
jgi:hypothetical protein